MLTGPAFVFPGQGSQYPGMIRDLSVCGPAARDLVDLAERATGLELRELMTRGAAATIADPQVAQLVVFVSSSVLLAELRERGVEPAVVAGHSLGEYTALTACGSLDWLTALALVASRGTFMSEAAREREGTMGAVVGLSLTEVERLCRTARGQAARIWSEAAERRGVAVVANVNSARQVVVSGDVEAVTSVLEAAQKAGALRAKRIPVGGAYHSPLMDAARCRLAELLPDVALRPPRLPMVSSITGELVTDLAAYKERLSAQVTEPVRWHATALRLAELGAAEFVEVGPGRVLAGLGREILRDRRHVGAVEAVRRAPASRGRAQPRRSEGAQRLSGGAATARLRSAEPARAERAP